MKDEIKEILCFLADDNRVDERFYKALGKNECQKLLDYITTLQEENEKLKRENNLLKADIEASQEIISDYKKEEERLNNIINELEKWLLEENKKKQKWYNEQLSTNDKRYYEETYLTSLTMINVFFDKLQELKRSGKK